MSKMMRLFADLRLAAVFALAFSHAQAADTYAPVGAADNMTLGGLPMQQAIGGTSFTATGNGATASASAGVRAGHVINVQDDFGAACDGTTDDAPAINAALTYIRTLTNVTANTQYAIGRQARLVFPPKNCVIKSTLNMTQLYGSGFVVDAWGSKITCQTNGTPCVDMTMTGQAQINGLNIYGDCTSGKTPDRGLVIARGDTTNNTPADHTKFDHPTIVGCFTLTAYEAMDAETTLVDHGEFNNSTSGGYAGVWDGSNYFNFQSPFTGKTYPQGSIVSFNENTCIECYLAGGTSGGSPIWMNATSRHKFIRSYAIGVGGPSVILAFYNGGTNDFLDLDIHSETTALTAIVGVIGASTPVINRLSLNDPYPENSGPIFKRLSGVSSVTLTGVDIDIGQLAGTSPSWWDSVGAWNVSGYIFNSDATLVLPTTFSGRYCVQSTCTTSENLGAVNATSINSANVYASNVTAAVVGNAGGVSSASIQSPTNTVNWWSGNTLAGALPAPVVNSTNGAGGGAALTLSNITLGSSLSLTGGTSCTNGDTFKINDPQSGGGLVGGGNAIMTATSVSGGVISAGTISASSGNAYLWLKPFSAGTTLTKISSTCVGLPTLTPAVGGEIWQLENNIGSLKASFSVANAGSGYTQLPSVSFTPAYSQTYVGGGTVNVTLSSSMSMSAGSGLVSFDSGGTELGISGTSGAPVSNKGAEIDATAGSAIVLTTGGDSVPTNVSLRRYKPAGTLATATINLPTAFADGQLLQLDLYGYNITALTFSPSVTGFTNATIWTANTSHRLRWDAAGSVWFLEQ